MNTKQIIALIIIISVITSVAATLSFNVLIRNNYLNFDYSLVDWFRNFASSTSSKIDKIESIAQKPATDYEAKIIAAVKKASPAVVSVIGTKDLPVLEQYYINPFEGNDFFKQFFGNDFVIPQYKQKGTQKQEISGGTGFIISSDGLIITNKHVVSDENAEYTVLTNSGEKIPAKILARDPVQDLAILKINKSNLPYLTLGNSDTVEIGQSVIAIGNALGEFRNTVSVGIISGLSRSIAASGGGTVEQLENVIQTDAAINLGNSGGPLLNLYGEVIGINVAMASGAQNIGFALPVNSVKKAINDIKTKGKIVYPFLGVRYIIINDALKQKNNLSVNYGALVIRGETKEDLAVIPGSPADKAGIVENDIILEVDGIKINEENTLAKLIQKKNVGDTVTLKVLSKGVEKIVKVTLEERK